MHIRPALLLLPRVEVNVVHDERRVVVLRRRWIRREVVVFDVSLASVVHVFTLIITASALLLQLCRRCSSLAFSLQKRGGGGGEAAACDEENKKSRDGRRDDQTTHD